MSYEVRPLRWPVKAWPILSQLVGNTDANIAGGYAAWHMSNSYPWNFVGQAYEPHEVIYDNQLNVLLPSDIPKDIDIFTYSQSGYLQIVARLAKSGFKVIKESQTCTTWEDMGGFLNEGNWSHLEYALTPSTPVFQNRTGSERVYSTKLPIQLIKPLYGHNLIDILDHFDFYLAKVALLDGKTAFVHTQAIEMMDTKNLISSHPEQLLAQPFYVLGRYLKYVQKGYKVNYMNLFKLVVNAQAVTDETLPSMPQEQLLELVVHFGKYLHSGEPMARGEDFRPTLEEAYSSWLSYLKDKKRLY